MTNDFQKFALSNGVSSLSLHNYISHMNGAMSNRKRIIDSFVSPNIIEERQMNVAMMDVFSRMFMDRIIFLGDEIDDYGSNIVTMQLTYLNSVDDKDIKLYINSPGGIVSSGMQIIDTMNYINCDVSTVVTGMAASMASVILANGADGKRYALPHAKVMIHQPLGGTSGQAADMEIAVEEMKKVKNSLYTILADRTGQTYEKIEKDCDRDHYFTAQEALEYGLIDKIYTKQSEVM